MNVSHYRSLMKDDKECGIISSHWPLKYFIHRTIVVVFLHIIQRKEVKTIENLSLFFRTSEMNTGS